MTSAPTSKISKSEWKYAQPPLRREGRLAVSGGHRIHWEEYGNPAGEPVLFVHGGPGGGCTPPMARYFNPKRYRIILFDQRGCGQSTPGAARSPRAALTRNTTGDLIADMMQLRAALGIAGKTHVFGGSWGSTLAMAFAQKHPETVQTLILRGIFLCRRQDLDFFYQGNAATYPRGTAQPGTYLTFPEAWKQFVEFIPKGQRRDMVKAYAEIFAREPKTAAGRKRQTAAAIAWSIWEGSTSYRAQDMRDLGKFAEPAFAKAFAKIENHYFMNGAFLGGAGEKNRDNNYLLENIARLKDIPIHIVHGRYDQVCPRFQADDLVAALAKAGHQDVYCIITDAGHSMTDRENALALVKIMDTLPKMRGPAGKKRAR